jgi:cellobiose-specific phosphotransferase system component IIA
MQVDLTQEQLEALQKLEQQKAEAKPVNFVKNVEMLIKAHDDGEISINYAVKEKKYPSDMLFYHGEGGSQTLKNATLSQYIGLAECEVIKENPKKVLEKATEMMKKELNLIREVLG